MSHYARARSSILKALEGGNRVTVLYVHAPLDEAVRGAIDRAASDNGQIEAAPHIASVHAAAQANFLRLAEEMKGRGVEFRAMDATKGREGREIPLRELRKQSYTQPLDALKRAAILIADAHLADKYEGESGFFKEAVRGNDPWRQTPQSGKPDRIRSGNAPGGDTRAGSGTPGEAAAGQDGSADNPGLAASTAPAPPPSGHTGPGAASVEEFAPNRFGQRVKSDARLRESWRESMAPRQYKRFTKEEMQAAANRWIAGQGLDGAAALFLDDESGLDVVERTVLGMQVALRIDKAAGQIASDASAVSAADALMDEVENKLEELAGAAGHGLRAFGMWARMSPEGILRKVQRDFERRNPGQELPPLPSDLKRRLQDITRQIKAAPEGSFIRQDLNRQMMAELARWEGLKVMDMAMGFWYANTLSSPDTHNVNFFGSGMHLLARMGAIFLAEHPRDSLAIIQGLVEGVTIGWDDAKAALRGRGMISEESDKFGLATGFDRRKVLELLYTENPSTLKERAGNLLALGRFVGRALTAEDGFWNGTARSAAEFLAASRLARRGVKEGHGDYATLMAQELHNAPEMAAAAMAQAREEIAASGRGVLPSEVRRRAWEIMDAQRAVGVREEGMRFALVTTFNAKPEGAFGFIAEAMNSMSRNIVIPTRYGNIPIFRIIVAPFVNVVANVTSMGLDFSPVGILRGRKGVHLFGPEEKAQPFSEAEKRRRMAIGLASSAACLALIAQALSGDEDDDKWFDITDGGPSDFNKRRQLMDQGWKPWALKFGNTFVGYQEMPGGPVFAGLASMISSLRKDPKGVMSEPHMIAGSAAASMIGGVFDRSFLKGAADVVKAVETRRSEPIISCAMRPAKGFVPASGLLRSISRITDPDRVDRRALMAHVVEGIPVIQSWGSRPALNAFGEPVTLNWAQRFPGLSRFVSRRTPDPEFAWLGERGLFITDVNDSATIALDSPTVAQRHTVETVRTARANSLGRTWTDTMRPEEAYRYAQEAGKLTRDAVRKLRNEAARHPEWTNEELKSRLDSDVRAVRKIAKLRMLREME